MQRDTIRRSPFLHGTLAALGIAVVAAAGTGPARAQGTVDICAKNVGAYLVEHLKVTYAMNDEIGTKKTGDILAETKECVAIPAGAGEVDLEAPILGGKGCEATLGEAEPVTLIMGGGSLTPTCDF